MKLSERMVNFRAVRRISQRELAKMVGVSLQTINTIESEKQTPSKVTAAKIQMVIGKEENDGIINQPD